MNPRTPELLEVDYTLQVKDLCNAFMGRLGSDQVYKNLCNAFMGRLGSDQVYKDLCKAFMGRLGSGQVLNY